MTDENKNFVPYADRDEEVNNIRILSGMLFNNPYTYQGADLLHRGLKALERKGSELSIKEITTIQVEWEKHWLEYLEKKQD